jgi:DNA-directed RNA polymerase subunit RPC12/RpoP
MFFETDRLAREAEMEAQMATESFQCSKCGRKIVFTADEGQALKVTCKCGHKMLVLIEKQAA